MENPFNKAGYTAIRCVPSHHSLHRHSLPSPLPVPSSLPIPSPCHPPPLAISEVEKTRFRAFGKKRVMDGPTDGPTDPRTDRPSDRPTDGWTGQRTDRPSYRDARTHLNQLPKGKKWSSVHGYTAAEASGSAFSSIPAARLCTYVCICA